MDAKARWRRMFLRAVIEIAFILFLFYANLLMGEFVRSADPADKTLITGLLDIITYKNFGIGVGCAIVGYLVFEQLRKLP